MSAALQLPARLDLSAAMQLVLDLRSMDSDVEIDASEVNHLGALCLQAIIAAANKAKTGGHSFTMTGASEKIIEQLKVMGTSPEQLMEKSL